MWAIWKLSSGVCWNSPKSSRQEQLFLSENQHGGSSGSWIWKLKINVCAVLGSGIGIWKLSCGVCWNGPKSLRGNHLLWKSTYRQFWELALESGSWALEYAETAQNHCAGTIFSENQRMGSSGRWNWNLKAELWSVLKRPKINARKPLFLKINVWTVLEVGIGIWNTLFSPEGMCTLFSPEGMSDLLQ